MKTKITLGIFAILLALFFTTYSDVVANSGGSIGGRSGSMGDNGVSCGAGGCHGGGDVTQPGIITTDVPASGYVPGMTYRVNVAGTSGTGVKFGFELAAENSSNATAGTLAAASPGAREQILSNGHATHTSAGNTGVMGNFGWQLDWTAPTTGAGSVTFYTAVLVANNNGTNVGDATIKYSTTVTEASTSSIMELTSEDVNLYPNPVANNLNLYSSNATINMITILNMEGKLVYESTVRPVDQIDVSFMEKGMYFVTVRNANSQYTKRMIKL